MDKVKLMEALQEALQQQDSNSLETLAKEAVTAYPQEAFGYFFLSEANVLNLNYANAEICLAKAIELDKDPSFMLRFASLKEEQGLFDDARLVYSKVLNQDASNYQALLGMGHYAYNEAQDFNLATSYYSQAIKANAQEADAYIYRAHALIGLGEYEQALEDAQKAHKGSFDESVEVIRAQAYSALKKDNELGQSFKSLADNCPDNFFHQFNYGNYLFASGAKQAAEQQYRKIAAMEVKQGAYTPSVYIMLATLLLENNKAAEALKELDVLISKDPENEAALSLRAEANEMLGNFEAALHDLQLATDLVSESSRMELLLKQGYILIQLNRLEEAAAIFETASEDPSLEREAEFGLGVLYDKKGESEKAFEYLNSAAQAGFVEAKAYLRQKMGAVMAEQAKLLEKDYVFEFPKNEQSILAPFFGQLLQYDLDKNPFPAHLPKEFIAAMQKAVADAYLMLTERALMLVNKEDYTVGFYKIIEQAGNTLTLELAPTNGNVPFEAKMLVENNSLSFGFASAKTKKPAPYKVLPVEQLSAAQKATLQKYVQVYDLEVLGEKAQKLKEAIFNK